MLTVSSGMPENSSSVPPDTLLHLRAAGVSVVVHLHDGRMPEIVHWGADLGELDAEVTTALAAAAVPLRGTNDVDDPVVLTLPIHTRDAYTGRPGISGSRRGRAWCPCFTPSMISVDGDQVSGWFQGGPAEIRILGRDSEAELEVDLTIELLPSGLLRTRATLRNTGDLYDVHDVVLALPVPAQAAELLDFAGRWGREKSPQRSPFTVGTHLREGRKGRTGADAAGILHAGAPGFGFAAGEIWSVHTAWSGNHIHYAELDFMGHRVIGGGELLLPGEVRLARGDEYTTPWVYANYADGLDAIARRFHSHLRSRDTHVGWHRPVTLNVWEAVYFDHDLDRLLQLAERGAAVGVERYVLDDGWFGSRRDDTKGLGDWVVSQEAWPQGLHPLIDRVRELGMEFGLWFEPEMVNPDSDLARVHPEWIMSARRGWPAAARRQQVLNLAIPECYEHVRDQILAILGEYPISYLKWDHNRDLIEAGDQTAGGAAAVHTQTAAFYRMLDEIRARHPGLEIESCSSGGGRVDLEVIEHTDRVWVSDCIDPLERQSMLRWSGQLLPPELLGSHIASKRSHTTGRVHDLNFRAATAVFGHLGIEWDLTEAGDRDLTELRAWIDFYKHHRELLLTGDVVRMDHPGDGFLVHGVVSKDRTEAIFAMVVVASPLADPGPRMRFRELDPELRYRVRPALVGTAPSGLVAPRWWGGAAEQPPAIIPGHPYPAVHEPISYPGAVLTGSQLTSCGLVPPRLHLEQALLYHVTAESTERQG